MAVLALVPPTMSTRSCRAGHGFREEDGQGGVEVTVPDAPLRAFVLGPLHQVEGHDGCAARPLGMPQVVQDVPGRG